MVVGTCSDDNAAGAGGGGVGGDSGVGDGTCCCVIFLPKLRGTTKELAVDHGNQHDHVVV